MNREGYLIRGGAEGRERLALLSRVMGESTRSLLGELGIAPGTTCLDLGCGGGDVSRELARLVGPSGRVIGVDRDAAQLEIARREIAELGLQNVDFEARDATTWESARSFDVAYARFLLTHLADPVAVLAAMRRGLRSGGVLAVEDIDFRGHFAEPDCPALGRSVELYTAAVRRRGGDAEIGPRLVGLFRAVGLEDVHVRVFHPVALQGGMKDLVCVTIESIAPALIEEGLATPEELREIIGTLWAFTRDPRTLIGGPRVFQVWGRAPRPA